jgi:outer membrane protein assembly factor BamB
MKITRNYLLLSVLLILSGVLSACAGGTGTNISWPGLTVDESNQVAFVAQGSQVYAIDVENGSAKWLFPEKADRKMSFYAAPALLGEDQVIVGGYDKVLYNIDRQNGQVNWSFPDATNLYVAGPLVTDQVIFAPNSSNTLYALGIDGKKLWSFEAEHSLWSTPAFDGKLVYLPSMDHHVYALDAQSGSQVWMSEDLGGAIAGDPTLDEAGILYVGTFNNELVALDTRNNGEVIWRAPAEGWVWSGPALDGGKLYFGDLSGYFYVVNAADGSLIDKLEPAAKSNQLFSSNPQGIINKPLIFKDKVYFTSEDGNLYEYDPASGAKHSIWVNPYSGKLYAGPESAGDLILVAIQGGKKVLAALDENGKQAWFYPPDEQK